MRMRMRKNMRMRTRRMRMGMNRMMRRMMNMRMRMRMRMMKNMMMIMSVLDLTHIRDIPTLSYSNNVLRGHSRIRASTCIPRRWMAGRPCHWWPVEVEIKMNPYCTFSRNPSHVIHGWFSFQDY